ncbi:aminotransferase class I/II-fold pyridoxal phosphate-dependent enzyme [Paenibacillus sp. strain BS8-2]
MILRSLQCSRQALIGANEEGTVIIIMKPFHAPLYEALIKHTRSKPVSFHVPGHQNGEIWRSDDIISQSFDEMAEIFGHIMTVDVTELSSTDDLHHPEAAIKEAQHLAAKQFSADATYFLVGGSTAGNLAMLLTVCDPGDLVIVQRNVHKSVINGLRLSGATAIFLAPQLDNGTGLAVIPSVDQIQSALLKYPSAKAVLLSNPNYYGVGADLRPYAEMTHRFGIPLLVDEAHGAHYGQHSELPRSAMQGGADAAVQSTHKTLPTLTMGAMLHIRGNRINRDRLEQALAMVQSSSPSFPIMATLDISRAMMTTLGAALFQSALHQAQDLRTWLGERNLLIKEVAGDSVKLVNDKHWQRDPLRIVIYDAAGVLSGHELRKLLEDRGCWAEMSDSMYVVLLIGIGTGHEQMERLKDAFLSIHHDQIQVAARTEDKRIETKINPSSISDGVIWEECEAISEPVVFGGGWYRKERSVRIPVTEAAGKRVAEMVIPYPPGIPLLIEGEVLTEAKIAQLGRLASTGANFQGARDPEMNTIAVYIDEI